MLGSAFLALVAVCISPVAAELVVVGSPSTTISDPRIVSPKSLSEELADSQVLIFGELHGNKESPAVVAEFIELVLEGQSPHSVVVAMELPSSLQPALDKFFDGRGDIQLLMDDQFWSRSMQDGRSSQAVLELLSKIKLLGSKVRLVAIDGRLSLDGSPQAMPSRAARLAANVDFLAATNPSALVVGYMGNFNASERKRDHLSPAASLMQSDPLSVLLLPLSGSSWNCQIGCKERSVSEIEKNPRSITKVAEVLGFDLVIPLPSVTSSPPAVET